MLLAGAIVEWRQEGYLVPRKRLTKPEAVLQKVVTALEGEEYKTAILTLLSEGPLFSTQAYVRERESPEMIPYDLEPPATEIPHYRLVGLELIQFLRNVVRTRDLTVAKAVRLSGTRFTVEVPDATGGIDFHSHAIRLHAMAHGRAVKQWIDGPMREVAILQLMALLEVAGLPTVQACSAADCRRLFVKVYRRQFCSVRCQKRSYARMRREQAAREAEEQAQRQARRRRVVRRSKNKQTDKL
jgi:hypothetical protein